MSKGGGVAESDKFYFIQRSKCDSEKFDWNITSSSREDNNPVPTGEQSCLHDELIGASTLCLQAKKKISLPLDTIPGNISIPSSESSCASGLCQVVSEGAYAWSGVCVCKRPLQSYV